MSILQEIAADPSLQAPPPRRRRGAQLSRSPEVDIIQLLRHELDSCAEFALTHCIGKGRSERYSASYLTGRCISGKMPMKHLELLARYNLVDPECGHQLTMGNVQGEHELIYDEYFDFFLERCSRTDGLWDMIHSVEIGEKLIGKTTVNASVLARATKNSQIFRFLLSHLPDPVPAYDDDGDWYLPALKNAAQFGHVETLKVLLAREDVNVNAKSPDDEAPYAIAASLLTGTSSR
ncbi:hypothetical protein DFS34DRAFT_597914 [Phlyctochytrium arcticum]|nr:hypothetical protein DFS34DRAFT_597914 [Phlyctochytrium arcticum]